jgi:CubicO group peptidase (beta-lactamase class C family)
MRSIVSALLLLVTPAIPAQDELSLRLDALLAVDTAPGPGFVLGVVQGRELSYTRGVGLADIPARLALTDSSVMGIASLTKQFTAACIWRLVQEGKLTLDDELRTYVPELPDYGTPIRIRHALNHTSGIRNYHALMDLSGFNYDSVYHDNASILALACRQRALNNLPGQKVLYGNTAYTLIALVIERVSGQDLNTFAQEHLLVPLGMHDTYYRMDLHAGAELQARGYTPDANGANREVQRTQCSYGAGGMVSSVRDLARWAAMVHGSDMRFGELAAFLVQQETLPGGDLAGYARGTMVNEYKGVRTVHHSGYAQGGRAQMISVPDLHVSVIVLTNTEVIDPEPLAYRALDALLHDNPAPMQAEEVISMHRLEDLPSFVGHFQELNSDMTLDISIARDTVWAKGAKARQPTALSAVGWGTFQRVSNANVRYAFDTLRTTEHDLVVTFGAAPFYFARVLPADLRSVELQELTGRFRSEELEVEYHMWVQDGSLRLSYPGHHNVALSPRQADAFGNGERVLYRFTRDRTGAVAGLLVSSEGTVKDIFFAKMER